MAFPRHSSTAPMGHELLRLFLLDLLGRHPSASRFLADTMDPAQIGVLWELALAVRDRLRQEPFSPWAQYPAMQAVIDACRTLRPEEFRLWFDRARA